MQSRKRHKLRYAAVRFILLGILLASPFPSAAQSVLEDGDLFVGGEHTFSASGMIYAGIIQHIRSSTVRVWCQSPDPFSFPNERWAAPSDVLVDSQGRVVFLAGTVSPGFLGSPGTGLFRCNGPGAPVEKLAVFPHVSSQTFSGFPFTGPVLGRLPSGLHLARHRSIAIDDDENNGLPKVTTDDAYVLVIQPNRALPGEIPVAGLPETLRYRVTSGEWEAGPKVVQGAFPPFCGNCGFVPLIEPDAFFHNGATYSAADHVLGRDKDPLQVKVTAQIDNLSIGVSLSLFGGYKQLPPPGDSYNTLVTDDVSIPNVPSGCPPPPPSEISDSMPVVFGGFVPPSGVGTIGFDEYGTLGLVLTSSFAGLPRVLTNVSEALINDSSFDDNGDRFRSNNGCVISDSLKFTPVLNGMDFTQLASTPQGLVGTQRQGTVAFVTSSSSDPPIVSAADGLEGATGIAAWPPKASPGFGGVIIIRIDSPVDVLLTDSSGKKLGVENGQPVNDFGSDGFDSGAATHPRFYAINSPAAGTYAVESAGTGVGPFTVHVYTADLDKPLGKHISQTGNATPGSTAEHDFTLAADGALSFLNTPPVNADSIAPTTVASPSPGPNAAGWNKTDVAVTLSSLDNADGSGVQSITFTLTGAQTGSATVTGSSTSILITAEGTTTVIYGALDNAGNVEAAKTVIVRLDKTAPTINASRTPNANEKGWNNTDVTASYSASDSVSGLDANSTATGSHTFTAEGAGQSRTFTATDLAGNSASATVSGVSIDKTKPTISASRAPAANEHGWNKEDVTASYSASDGLSGLASPATGSYIFTAEGAGQSRTFTVEDLAGNFASATISDVNIDKTAPVITASAPQNGAEYLLNQAVIASYTCADVTSGLASCLGTRPSGASVPTGVVGPASFAIEATDVAGNIATASIGYAVGRYGFAGFFSPLANLPAVNLVNAGRTIPVKWRLTDARGVLITDVKSFVSLTSAPIACDASAGTNVGEEGSAAGETTVRYDSDASQFIFNWKTESGWSGCRLMQVSLADGSIHVAKIRMK